MGTVAQRLIFAVSVPVRARKQVAYALVMSLEPERLVEILQAPRACRRAGFAAVADRKNINMARSRGGAEIPRPAGAGGSRVKQYADRAQGVITDHRLRGTALAACVPLLTLTGWRVAAWAPLSLVEGPLREAWTVFLWSGAVLLSLSVLLASASGG